MRAERIREKVMDDERSLPKWGGSAGDGDQGLARALNLGLESDSGCLLQYISVQHALSIHYF